MTAENISGDKLFNIKYKEIIDKINTDKNDSNKFFKFIFI